MNLRDAIQDEDGSFYPNQIPVEIDLVERNNFQLVLEVGCGRGVRQLLQRGINVLSLDLSQDAILRARSRLGNFRNWSPVRSDAMHLPLREGVCDLVLCFETMDYFASPSRFLTQTWAALRQDGILLLSTRNAAGLHHVILHTYAIIFKFAVLLKRRRVRVLQAEDRTGFLTARALNEILKRNGFTSEAWFTELGILVFLDALWSKLNLRRPRLEVIGALLLIDTRASTVIPRSLASGWTIVCRRESAGMDPFQK
jgi:SAM-dependent methyltransferase